MHARRAVVVAAVLLLGAGQGAVAVPVAGGPLGDGGWVKLTLGLGADHTVMIGLAMNTTGPFVGIGYSFFNESGEPLGIFTVGSFEYSWLSLAAAVPGVGEFAVSPGEIGGGPYTVEGTLVCEGCPPRVLVIYTYVAGDVRDTRFYLDLEGAQLLDQQTGTEAFAYTDDDFGGSAISVDVLGKIIRVVEDGTVTVPTSGRVIGTFWPKDTLGGGTSTIEGVTSSCPCFLYGDQHGPVDLTLDKVGDASAIAIFAEIPA